MKEALMKHMILSLGLVLTLALMSACSDYRAQANPQATQASAELKDLQQAIKDLEREMRSSQKTLGDNVEDTMSRSFERKIEDLGISIADNHHNLDGRIKALVTTLETQAEVLASVKAETTKLGDVEKRTDALASTVNTLKDAVDGLKATLAAVDLDKFLEVSRERADLMGRAIKAEAQLEAAHTTLESTNAKIDQLLETIATLEHRITELDGADISQHPDFLKVKSTLAQLRTEKDELQDEFNKMKNLADSQAEEIDKLKSGVAPTPEQPVVTDETPGYEAGFRALVKTSQFVEATKEFLLLVDLKEGEMPKRGEVLVILDEEGEIISEFRVTQTFDTVQFGGESIDAQISRAPTVGDVIRRRRAISAGGVDE